MNPLVLEKLNNPPVLIIDEEGAIGKKLAERLAEVQVVLVTLKEIKSEGNLIHVPFEKPNPLIPNNFYSHIILINPEDYLESIPSFMEKAKSDRSSLVVCSYFINMDALLNKNQDYEKEKLIFYGDVFGGEPLKTKNPSIINRFLNQAKIRGRIDIPGEGLAVSHPVFIDDLIDGILETAFGLSNDKIYYLFPKHGLTLLALANLIQRTDPTITIDFVHDEKIESPQNNLPGTYLLPDNYKLDKKISALGIKAGNFRKSEIPEEVKKKRETSPFRILTFSFLFFLFLPIISTLILALLGEVFLGSAKTSLANGRETLSIAKNFFVLASQTSKVLAFETQILPFSFSDEVQSLIDSGAKESTGIDEFYKGEDKIFSGNAKDGIEHINNFLLFEESQKPVSGKYSVVDEKLFNVISSTINIWPQILGLEGEKRYLILLTNNEKLRPGGGEIEAFATFGLDKGKLVDFKVQKPSETDKDLKGHVEPPYALRKYLGKTNLFFKDSNFSPDFTESASSSAFFINTEQKDSIDGVILLDSDFLNQLLQESSLFLGKLNIEVNSNNLGGLIKEHENDEGFFMQILEALKNKIAENPGLFISNLSNSLTKKNILVAFGDPKVQNIFTLNDFSGSLSGDRVTDPTSFNDFLGIVDSNFGNPGVLQKRADEKVSIGDDGSVTGDLTVQYQGGDEDRRVYLQFLLPQGSTLNKVKIDGEEKDLVSAETNPDIYESKDFQQPKGLEIENRSDKGKMIFGFLINVVKGKTVTVEIGYSSQAKISTSANFSYDLRIFKQAGAGDYPLNLSIVYPISFSLGKIPKDSNLQDGKISISKNVDRDFDLNFNFLKK